MGKELELLIGKEMTLEEFTMLLISKGKLPKKSNPKWFAFHTLGHIRLMHDAQPSRTDEKGYRFYSPDTLRAIYDDYATSRRHEAGKSKPT
jgi:hypothetical protein